MRRKTNQAFLFFSHLSSEIIIREFNHIRRAVCDMGTAFFLYDTTGKDVPEKIKKLSPYLYSDQCLCDLGYPVIGKKMIPGHAHFPLFKFYLDHPDFDYYWFIEYDVRFTGPWRSFFESFLVHDADFLTSHIRSYAEERSWPWWALKHPRQHIPLDKRLRSFNPLYRISRAALSFLHDAFRNGWCGHHEVALPTLLHQKGFTVREISGRGKYTIPGMENRFYAMSAPNVKGDLSGTSMKYRPSSWRCGREENKLYHPVKPLKKAVHENILYYGGFLSHALSDVDASGILFRLKIRHRRILDFVKYRLPKKESFRKPRVGIIITSFNQIDYTDRALESFYATINKNIDYELWLLDDSSSEDIEGIYHKYKDRGVKFFKNKTNNGLTSLWNKGIELNKDKDYLILCNNDVVFSNYWADHLIGSLKASPGFAVAVPVTNAPGHVPAQHIANFVDDYVPSDNQDEINLICTKVKNKNFRKTAKGNGFCFAARASLFRQMSTQGGPFNEKFPLYGSEEDFFRRVKPKTMIVPESFVFHYKHVSVESDYFPDQKFRRKTKSL
ncbi:MAG TPA: glycosyltransferase [Smithella sp.]|jgi:GT2 family glycosyltransferase|nr:glycosyltransferase [Smithella sp.]HPK22230.1 glycosyltransferase [Smithella sp.]HPR16547.1 glycosyltransferase [Smithella sp.]